MFTLTCPKCQRNSYSSDEESFFACPYCGFKFSRKYGPDKRSNERTKQEICFALPYQERHFEACTIDSSEKGLRIKIFDDPQITEGDTMDLTIGDLQINAKVMWVSKLPDKAIVGLQRLN